MKQARLPAWLMPWARRAVHLNARLFNPMTLGVRAVILDGDDRIFLVKHSYVAGWHFPGGGVEAGESALEALVREVAEEAAIAVEGQPPLHGVFFNRAASRRDHVLVYVVRDFRVTGTRAPDWEIVDAGFFPLNALPPGTSRATLARLREIREGAALAADW